MRANLLFVLGAITGVILAATGLLDNKNHLALGSGTVAEVNGTAISEAQYVTIVQAIAEEKKNSLEPKEYEFILQRIIDEELLVQQGYDLGLLQLNSVIRNEVVKAVTASIIAKNSGETPTRDELENFYNQHKAFFQPATKLHISHMKFKEEAKAIEAYSLLQRGEDFDEVKAQLANQTILSIPDALLPVNDLVKYVGPTLVEKAALQEELKLYPPIQQNQDWHLLVVQNRAIGEALPLDQITQVVATEYQRRSDEEAFREYLKWLRNRASVQSVETEQLQELLITGS